MNFKTILYCSSFIGITRAATSIRGQARYNDYPLSATKCGFQDNSISSYAAVGPNNFLSSSACGQCVNVVNPETLQSVHVTIVDQCLGCGDSNIMLNRASFASLADTSKGFVEVDWVLTPCKVRGFVEYDWVQLPDTDLIGLKISNLAVPISKADVFINRKYYGFKRMGNNLFGGISVGEPGSIVGLRITSIHDEVLYEPEVMVHRNVHTVGTAQFSKVQSLFKKASNGGLKDDSYKIIKNNEEESTECTNEEQEQGGKSDIEDAQENSSDLSREGVQHNVRPKHRFTYLKHSRLHFNSTSR